MQTNPLSAEFTQALGSYLRAEGLLDDLSLRRAERAQSQTGQRLDAVLTGLGLLTDVKLAKAFAALSGLPFASLDDAARDAPAIEGLTPAFLETALMVPLADRGNRVAFAVADPFNSDAVQAVAYLVGRPLDLCVAPKGEIKRALERMAVARQAPAPQQGEGTAAAGNASDADIRQLEELASEAPVIRLVQDLIARSVDAQASDIHIEAAEDSVKIRTRIDGELTVTSVLDRNLNAAIASRIKIMAGLDIAERRLPQDGRVKVNVRGREIDLRISTMPTLWGESIVLRILDRSSVELDFAKLGFAGKPLADLEELLAQPNGILLVTGPTGSGKTTTLYTAIKALNTPARKILTVEDPVEYQLAGINQVQVQPKIGLTFATALRSILRQDPDVMMIGEIRDLETAHIAIQSALTGHLVLSTIHTNSAAATVPRLIDMGVERYLLGSTLKGVLAQRLVRRLCPACRRPTNDTPRVLDLLASTGFDVSPLDPARCQVYEHQGCPACRNTGFSGRTTIYELMRVRDGIRDAILEGASEASMERTCASLGVVSLLQSGLLKALAGETTPAEVMRATRLE